MIAVFKKIPAIEPLRGFFLCVETILQLLQLLHIPLHKFAQILALEQILREKREVVNQL